MAKNDWDEIMEEEGSGHETHVHRKGSAEPRRSSLLPWLLFLLTGAALATMLVKGLEARDQARRVLATARDEAAELRKQLFKAQDQLAQAEKDRSKEAQTAAALVAKTSASDKLISDLKSQLDAKEGDIESEQNRITVNLVDEILFKSGDATISPRGQKVLSKVGAVLKNVTDQQIMIGGHTDDRPIHTAPFPSNWELSAARAVNVVHYLAEQVGVDPARLTAAGYSEFHPRSKRDKAKNRRIEILLTPTVQIKK
jgi:chemotaxis protein MotB